jgi:ABC-type transport system involved in multi-copper enzyme maturation permease subunit
MSAATVIARELRAEARRGVNYWLRCLAASALIVVFVSVTLSARVGLHELGALLFASLHRTLLLALWIIVPLMTADCVNREKREGTLGLLFLTPLTVLDVILAKVTVHGVRALTLFLAAVPVLGLPIVLGGVEWVQALVAVAHQANAVLLGIAAGIYASTVGGSITQVMVLAEGCALALAIVSAIWMSPLGAISAGMTGGLGWAMAGSAAASSFLFCVVLKLSVKRLKQTWQQETAALERPRWVEMWVERFSSPGLLQSIFHWDKGRTLDRNPIAWLQEYSWTARLTKWGWFLGLLIIEFLLLTDDAPRGPAPPYQWLAGMLALGVAFSAARSLRRENETGLLELLLVTPLSIRRIVNGRLWGVCCHYVPALVLLLAGLRGDQLLNPKAYLHTPATLIFANPLSFVAVMTLGVYLSLGRLNFFLAWPLAWVAAFGAPVLLASYLQPLATGPTRVAVVMISVFDIALSALMWVLIQRCLGRRSFLQANPGA